MLSVSQNIYIGGMYPQPPREHIQHGLQISDTALPCRVDTAKKRGLETMNNVNYSAPPINEDPRLDDDLRKVAIAHLQKKASTGHQTVLLCIPTAKRTAACNCPTLRQALFFSELGTSLLAPLILLVDSQRRVVWVQAMMSRLYLPNRTLQAQN